MADGRELAAELGGQAGLQLVFGHTDGIGFGFERELDFQAVLLRAKDDPYRGTIFWRAFAVVMGLTAAVWTAVFLRALGVLPHL